MLRITNPHLPSRSSTSPHPSENLKMSTSRSDSLRLSTSRITIVNSKGLNSNNRDKLLDTNLTINLNRGMCSKKPYVSKINSHTNNQNMGLSPQCRTTLTPWME